MLTKGIVYVTNLDLPADVSPACQRQLLHSGLYILSVSLAPLDFGDNIVLGLAPGPLTVFKQILMGVSNLQEDIAFICAPAVFYGTSHFDFTPPRGDTAYFNENALPPGGSPLWQMCASTRFLIDYYGARMKRIEYELSKGRRRGVGVPRGESWSSAEPNIWKDVAAGVLAV